MIRNKTKSKQIRAQSAKLDVIIQKRTQPIKMRQKLQNSPLRPSSQDYHRSLNHDLLHKNYLMIRNNLSSQKKNRRAKAGIKTNSNQFYINNLQAEDEFHSKQKIKNRDLKSRKQNIGKKDGIKDKQQKQTLQVRASNKQKEKKDKQQKQSKTKFPSFKAFIGTKLRRKFLINYSIRIRYKAPQTRRYKVYIGKGNNSKLVKKIFGNRFWWNIVTKSQNNKQVNLVWSQWSKPNIFNAIPKITKSQKQRAQQFEIQQEEQKQTIKTKSNKNKQALIKKLTPQNVSQIQHIYDLLQQNDKKLLCKKASKKQFKYENIKELISKQNIKTFKKLNVHLTHNHIENHQQFTNKKNLFINLKSYYKNQIFDIVPLTFHVTNLQINQNSNENSLENILMTINQYINSKEDKKDKTNLWIVKPGQNSNRGCGIQVFKKLQHIKAHIQKQKSKHSQRTFIVQKYLNPFLYHRRKFDIRCYLLITCTPQIRAYYYPIGYIRTSSCQFSTKNCSNRFIHLTNDAIQKKQQQYGKYQKGNKVTYQQFQNYLDLFENNKKQQNKKQLNFFKQILPKMQQMMLKTVKVMASKNKQGQRILNPNNKQHSFQLYGYDFMIDQNFIPWLIQINTNPCIQTGCQILQDIIPQLLQNVVKICVDTVFPPPKFQDWPLNQMLACPQTIFSQNQFQLIYSQCEE